MKGLPDVTTWPANVLLTVRSPFDRVPGSSSTPGGVNLAVIPPPTMKERSGSLLREAVSPSQGPRTPELYVPSPGPVTPSGAGRRGIAPEAQFAVKPRQARAMIAQAIAAGCHSGGSPPMDLRAGQAAAGLAGKPGRVLCDGRPVQRHTDHARG